MRTDRKEKYSLIRSSPPLVDIVFFGLSLSSFPSRFKTPERESSKRTISANGGLGRYRWYRNQTLGDVPARRLSLEGGGHEAVCQQGRWVSKGSELKDPTLIG